MPDESVRDFATRLQANWQNAQLGRSCEKDSVVLKFKHFLDNLKPEYSNSCGSPRKSLADLMVITKKGLIALKLKHFFFRKQQTRKQHAILLLTILLVWNDQPHS
jgi:hypothetical protein